MTFIPSYLSQVCQGLLHCDLVIIPAVNLCIFVSGVLLGFLLALFNLDYSGGAAENSALSFSVVDSDDTPGAICVRETHSSRWNVQGGNDIKRSLN